jgi:hypothetical protein
MQIAGGVIALAGGIVGLYGTAAWFRGKIYPVPPRVIWIMCISGVLIVIGATLSGHPPFSN